MHNKRTLVLLFFFFETRVVVFTYNFSCCVLSQMGHKAVQYSVLVLGKTRKRLFCCTVPFCSTEFQYLYMVFI